MERASKPYRRRRCSLSAQACHSPSPPRDGSECRAIGSEVQLQARQPRRPDLICPTPSMAPRSLPVRRVGSGAETCPVCCTWSLLVHGSSRAYSGRRSGSWPLRGGRSPEVHPAPSLHARRISKRETDLALKGAYWLLFTIPSPTPGPRTLARGDGYCLHWPTRETHDKCIPSACQLRRAVMRSSKRRASLAPSYSASHCSVAGFQGSTSDEASLEARHDVSRLPGSWEGG